MLHEIAKFEENLRSLMDPNVLSKLADLLKAFGPNKSPAMQYDFWIKRNGPNCRYAAMAKGMFEQNCAENVAKEIIKLYHCWAKHFEE